MVTIVQKTLHDNQIDSLLEIGIGHRNMGWIIVDNNIDLFLTYNTGEGITMWH